MMETINDIVRKVAEEMLNTSMQDITAEIINKWAVRIGDAAACEKSSRAIARALPAGTEFSNAILISSEG